MWNTTTDMDYSGPGVVSQATTGVYIVEIRGGEDTIYRIRYLCGCSVFMGDESKRDGFKDG
jgi:hypothetical protein